MSLEQPCGLISLDVALNIAGVEKYPRKTCGCDQPRGHLIRVLIEGAFATMEIFLLWLVISNQFDIRTEAHFSFDTVGRELWLAKLS